MTVEEELLRDSNWYPMTEGVRPALAELDSRIDLEFLSRVADEVYPEFYEGEEQEKEKGVG